jgi:hypothetical protein
MSLLAIALLNGLLGAICGVWFKVQILIPLIGITVVEAAILKQTGMWSSVFLSWVMLIAFLEMGYLIGSSIGALWLHSGRERDHLRDFAKPQHGRLSHS